MAHVNTWPCPKKGSLKAPLLKDVEKAALSGHPSSRFEAVPFQDSNMIQYLLTMLSEHWCNEAQFPANHGIITQHTVQCSLPYSVWCCWTGWLLQALNKNKWRWIILHTSTYPKLHLLSATHRPQELIDGYQQFKELKCKVKKCIFNNILHFFILMWKCHF